jgi:cell division septal protein FtsQ
MRKRSAKRLVLILAAIAIFGGAAYVILSPTFEIKEITIAGNSRITDEEVLRILPFEVGDHILFLRKSTSKKVLSIDERIAVCEIHRRYPDKVDVVIEEMTPVLLLSSGKIWGLSEKGTILPIKSPYEIPNLPFLSLFEADFSPEAYKKPDSRLLERGLAFWIEIQKSSPQFLDKVSEIIVSNDKEIRLVLSGNGVVANVGEGDYTKRVMRLQVVIDEMNRSDKRANYIDLRYSDQAVVRLDKSAKNKRSG